MATPFDNAGLGGTDAISIGAPGSNSAFPQRDTNPGFLGAGINALFGSRESRHPEFAQMAREERQSQAAAQVYQAIATRVQSQGMTPKAALVDFLQSPQGADYLAQDAGSLMKGVQDFVNGVSPETKVVPGGATLTKTDPIKGTTTPEYTAPDHVAVPIKDEYDKQIGTFIIDRTTGRVVSSTHPDIVPVGSTQQVPGQPGQGAPAPQAANPQLGTLDLARAKAATATIESGSPEGNYEAVGPANKKGQRAYGKYQVMDFNIPAWTKEATGVALNPQQFLKDRNAQEKVYEHFFTRAFQQTGDAAQAASIWFTGKANAPLAKDVTGTTGQQYTDRWTQIYLGSAPPNQPARTIQPAQQPGVPGAPGIPGQGAPGQKPSVPPYIPTRVISDPGAPQEGGTKKLWQQIPLVTGAITSTLAGAQRITGQFGVDVLPPEVSRARIQFRDAGNALIRATALNPRFIGAEQEHIRSNFSFDPGFFTDERTLADRVIYMDEKATQMINDLQKEWRNPRTPTERRKDIANGIQAFQQFKDTLGVPPPGHPDRANPPRSTFREQLDMGKQGIQKAVRGAKEAKREALGTQPTDLKSMSVDELLRQPNLSPDQRRRLEALKGAQ